MSIVLLCRRAEDYVAVEHRVPMLFLARRTSRTFVGLRRGIISFRPASIRVTSSKKTYLIVT